MSNVKRKEVNDALKRTVHRHQRFILKSFNLPFQSALI